MQKRVRAFIRLLLFALTTVSTVVLVAAGNLLLGVIRREWRITWKNYVIKSWAWITGFILGLELNVSGQPPKPPFFLVANHLSYIDVVLLWRYLDATFVAKSEIKSWPFFGWSTRILGVLFIDRALKRDVRRMNRRISETISDRQGVIIFPEGTSSEGAKVLPFNAPLLQYPADTQMPVCYATLSYETTEPDSPAHMNVCWWGDMPFFPHFWNVLKLKKIKAAVTFGEYSIVEEDRKLLARKLKQAVEQNFSPVVNKDSISS